MWHQPMSSCSTVIKERLAQATLMSLWLFCSVFHWGLRLQRVTVVLQSSNTERKIWEICLSSHLLFRLFSFFLPCPHLSLGILVFVLPAATRIRAGEGKMQKGTGRKEILRFLSSQAEVAGEDGSRKAEVPGRIFILFINNLIISFWSISIYVALFPQVWCLCRWILSQA